MPEQASLCRSVVPLDSALEDHLLRDLALSTPGWARLAWPGVIFLTSFQYGIPTEHDRPTAVR